MATTLTLPQVKFIAKGTDFNVICRLDNTSTSSWTLYYPKHSRLGMHILNGSGDPAQATLTAQIRRQFALAANFTINFTGI